MDELAAALNLDPAGSGFVASRTRARENPRRRRSFLECGAVLSERRARFPQWRNLGPLRYLNGKLYLEHVLPAPVSGHIGLWSKADSHVYFDDYAITPAN